MQTCGQVDVDPKTSADGGVASALTCDFQLDVPNSSFEDGEAAPASWTLTGGQGELITPGAVGQRAVSVTGDGKTNNTWQSERLPLMPDSVYRLRFQARRLQGTSGLPVSGPVFCNRDLPSLGSEWTTIESFFHTPHDLSPDLARLRFGQWEVDGSVAFDDVQLVPVSPVYQVRGDLRLGEGERLEGTRYTFEAPFQQASANDARVLARYQCTFNSNRWMLSESAEVIYRHQVGRLQKSAQVRATVGWYLHGELVVSVSCDGQQWQELGTLGRLGSLTCGVPEALLPSDDIWVKFTARRAAGDAQPPALQIHAYSYEATVDGPPEELVVRRAMWLNWRPTCNCRLRSQTSVRQSPVETML